MMRTVVLLLAIAMVTAAYADGNDGATSVKEVQADREPWQSDWRIFASEYPDAAAKAKYLGKVVVWQATVKQVKPPQKDKTVGTVGLTMETSLIMGEHSTQTIWLNPAEDEWDAWEGLPPGQRVKFTTLLKGSYPGAKAPVMIYVNRSGGESFVVLSTEGGKLLKTANTP